jgi:hypothetical protein
MYARLKDNWSNRERRIKRSTMGKVLNEGKKKRAGKEIDGRKWIKE